MTNAILPENEVCKSIMAMEPQFKLALPPQIPPARFTRIAITAIRNDPKLAMCDRKSLYSSLLKCAQDGLVPDGREAAIVPWGDRQGADARYMPMVGGICKKARNSGEIKTINAKVVYENDKYEAWTDENGEHFKHVPSRKDRGAVLLTYAYASTKDGGFYFEEVLESEMIKIKAMSKAGNSPWKGPFEDEMRRKSAIRRLAKYRLPSSSDIEAMTQSEDDLYDVDPKPKKEAETKSSRLSDVVDKNMASDAVVVSPDGVEQKGEEAPPI